MIFAVLGVSLGYYFLSYVPYKTAVSNFEKASTSLKEKNKDKMSEVSPRSLIKYFFSFYGKSFPAAR